MLVNPDGSVTPEPQAEPSPDLSGVALYKKAGGDWNKANESYFNAVNKLTETHQAMERTNQEVQRLTEVVQALAGGKGSVNQDPLAELEALGLPVDNINRAIDGRVSSQLDTKLAEMFNPIMSQMQAEEQLSSEIENFDQHKAAARAFMHENQEVAGVFNAIRSAKPVEAWKYAISTMLLAKAAATPGGVRPTGLPGGAAPQTRGAAVPAVDQAKREAEALDYADKYGDMKPYRRERFSGTSVEQAVQKALVQAGLAPREGDTGW